MRKRRFTRILALLLAMVMVFALPMEASASTRKVKATQNYKKAKAVKKGSTVVTVKKSSSNVGYVKFKAPATKTYKFTISNIHFSGRSSSSDICNTFVSFKTLSSYGLSSVGFKQQGKKVYSLYLCSKYSWKLSSKGKTAYTNKPSRTASIKLKKGETIYIYFSNIYNKKLCYNLKIK